MVTARRAAPIVLVLEETERTVSRAGDAPVRLRSKSFRLLAVLARNAPDAVSKDLLAESVWHGRVVSDGSISQCVRDIRRALKDHGRRLIQTVPGYGYKLNAKVSGWGPLPACPLARARVALLPFSVVGSNETVQAFAEGLTATVLAELTRTEVIDVLSPTLLNPEGLSNAELARRFAACGADYLIDGTVQCCPGPDSGASMRASATLVTCKSGSVVWSRRWQACNSDFFAVQDGIVNGLVNELAALWSGRIPELIGEEIRHLPTRNLDAYQAFQRAVILTRNFDGESILSAIECLEAAVSIDPEYTDAWAALTVVYGILSVALSGDELDTILSRRLHASRQCARRRPRSAWALLGGSWACAWDGNIDGARSLIREAVTAAPNNADLLAAAAGFAALNTDLLDEAETWASTALSLNAVRPDWYWFPIGYARFFRGDSETALSALADAPQVYPEVLVFRAACEAEMGYGERASATTRRLAEICPSFSAAAYLTSEPFGSAEKTARLSAAFLRAGLPQ